jgi:hypothetical protein
MENKFNFKTKRIKKDNTTKSQRQLRVGEELRHLISNALHRETFYDAVLESNNITLTQKDENIIIDTGHCECWYFIWKKQLKNKLQKI